MVAGIRLAQNPPDNLRNIGFRRPVCQAGENVGKRAVPAFFERVYRNHKAYRAFGRKQVLVFQLVNLGGFDGDLFGWNTDVGKRGFHFFKRGLVVFAARLGLKQHNRADIRATLFLRLCRRAFQIRPQRYRRHQHFVLRALAAHDDGQLHHLLVFQGTRAHIADDVAGLARRSGEFQHKTRIQAAYHVQRQRRSRIVAFIHHNHRIQTAQHINQRRFIVFGQQVFRLPFRRPHARKRSQIAVFTKCPQRVFAAPFQAVKRHHQNRNAALHRIRVKTVAAQHVFFVKHLHTSAEIRV